MFHSSSRLFALLMMIERIKINIFMMVLTRAFYAWFYYKGWLVDVFVIFWTSGNFLMIQSRHGFIPHSSVFAFGVHRKISYEWQNTLTVFMENLIEKPDGWCGTFIDKIVSLSYYVLCFRTIFHTSLCSVSHSCTTTSIILSVTTQIVHHKILCAY